MTTARMLVACALVFFPTLLMTASTAEVAPLTAVHQSIESSPDPPACGGEPCDAVVRGLRAFFDWGLEGLDGNGRACVDCHMATDSFQLSPANVEARFQLLLRRRRHHPAADDPLFRPVDADDFRINGESANAPSSETFVDVWRSVSTVNDVVLTGPDDGIWWARGPNETGGYQLDARVATLQEQASTAS
jgi:hypothetical protein